MKSCVLFNHAAIFKFLETIIVSQHFLVVQKNANRRYPSFYVCWLVFGCVSQGNSRPQQGMNFTFLRYSLATTHSNFHFDTHSPRIISCDSKAKISQKCPYQLRCNHPEVFGCFAQAQDVTSKLSKPFLQWHGLAVVKHSANYKKQIITPQVDPNKDFNPCNIYSFNRLSTLNACCAFILEFNTTC